MAGHVDNPFPLVENADIVLMCSRCEAFGRTTLEGMMLGKAHCRQSERRNGRGGAGIFFNGLLSYAGRRPRSRADR